MWVGLSNGEGADHYCSIWDVNPTESFHGSSAIVNRRRRGQVGARLLGCRCKEAADIWLTRLSASGGDRTLNSNVLLEQTRAMLW